VRPLKKFLVAPVLLVVLVPAVSVIASQVIGGSRQNVHGTIRGHQPTRAAMTIWERIRDPKGWWQRRLRQFSGRSHNGWSHSFRYRELYRRRRL
jgi:hypothetical protein